MDRFTADTSLPYHDRYGHASWQAVGKWGRPEFDSLERGLGSQLSNSFSAVADTTWLASS
jgi:hypothetical protein